MCVREKRREKSSEIVCVCERVGGGTLGNCMVVWCVLCGK